MVIFKAQVTRVGKDNKAHLSLENVELGLPNKNQVLVRVHVVAQNPTDVQSLDSNAFGEGVVLGCDFTGTVAALGAESTLLEVGDIVSGLVWGGEIKGLGGYSEFVFADEKICFKVPKSVHQKEAASLPLACTTAWLALYSRRCLNINRHADQNTPVLVWGGSSSVGLYAIQLAHLYSIPVVAVCSPKYFELCKTMGASWVFDYKDSKVVEKVKAEVPNIAHVFDCIGNENSSTQGSQTTGMAGGTLCTVRPGKDYTENVESRVNVTDVLVWTAFLKDHQYKEFKYPASKEDNELAAELFRSIPGWLESRKLRPNKVHTIPGGLSAIDKGFQMHRDKQISGFKLVYEL